MGVVVLGIGNILLSDEGIGVRAVEELQRRFHLPETVTVIDGGTCGMELLDQLGNADPLIIVDAVRVGRAPGSVVVLSDDEIGAFFKTKISPHQVGISDVLATLHLAGTPPTRVVLIGVQPVSLETGMELTAEVAGRMDEVVALVAAELQAAGAAPTPKAGH